MPANGDGRREIDLILLLSLTHGDVNGTDDSIGKITNDKVSPLYCSLMTLIPEL